MPPKRAYARPIAPDQPGAGDSYYGNNPRNPKTVAAQEAAQRLRALRAIVFAGPLLVVSSVGVVFSRLCRNEGLLSFQMIPFAQYLLYRRFVLGEEQKRLPPPSSVDHTTLFKEAKKDSPSQNIRDSA